MPSPVDPIANIIQKGLEKGFRPDYIRDVLLSKGYQRSDVDAAFAMLKEHPHASEPEESYPMPRAHHPQSTQTQPMAQPQAKAQNVKISLDRGDAAESPAYLRYTIAGLAALCVILLVMTLYAFSRPAEIIEIEKIVEVPVTVAAAPQEPEVSDASVREKLDNFAVLSADVDKKQEVIDTQLKTITGLAITMEEKEERISALTTQLDEVHRLMKEERRQVVSLLVDVLNYILGRTERVSG